MAHSQGFNPRPKISWAGAVPTGVASEAEYVELQLGQPVASAVLREELNKALPAGLDVLEVVEAADGALADRLEASQWRIELPGIAVTELEHAVDALLAADKVDVERMTKNGMRTLDARAALVTAQACTSAVEFDGSTRRGGSSQADDPAETAALSDQESSFIARVDDWLTDPEPYGILVTVVRQTTPVVRPDDVLSALRVVAGLAPLGTARAVRLAQGRLDDGGGLADPFAPERAAAGSRRGEPAVG